jgi:hypothetical protein
MKYLLLPVVFAILSLVSPVADAADKNTANYLYADPFGHLDQTVNVKVVSVHPEHFESKVNDVVWFMARTGSPEIQDGQHHLKPGGEIRVAVDSTAGGTFFHTYGDERPARSDGFVATRSLTGIFRASDRLLKADPNTRRVDQVNLNSGSFFIDCTTNGQFKTVESSSSSPSPSPGASPSPSSDAASSPSSSPSSVVGSIKSLMNKLGIHQLSQ